MPARNISAKVYLEGVEVPFQSITVRETAQANQTECQVIMPPHVLLKQVAYRTLLHVFVQRTSPSLGERWECLFEGEVMGYGTYHSADGGRGFQFNARALSSYWDRVKLYYIDAAAANTFQTAGAAASAAMDPPPTMQSTRVLDIGRTEAGSGLQSSSLLALFKDNSFPDAMKALFALPFARVSGEYAYQFAVDAEDRLKLTQRLHVSARDMGSFMAQAPLAQYLKARLQGSGAYIDLSDILELCLSTCFHDYVIPAAPVRRQTTDVEISRRGLVRDAIANPDNGAQIATSMRAIESLPSGQAVPANYMFKPQSYFLPPPTCNVLFPNQYKSRSFSRAYDAEITRMVMQTTQPQTAQTPGAAGEGQTFTLPIMGPREKFWVSGGSPIPLVKRRVGKITDPDGGTLEYTFMDEVKTKMKALARDYTLLTQEELEGGILSVERAWPPLASAMQQPATGVAQNYWNDARFSVLLDWMYWREYYGMGRSQTVMCEFLPHAMCGFSAMAIDASPLRMHVMGYVTSLTHVIDASGSAATEIGMALCREASEPRPLFNGSVLPGWLDANHFSDSNIGAYYADLLGGGCRSLTDEAAGDGDAIWTASERLADAFIQLEASGADAQLAFSDAYATRGLMTVDEIFSFLGASLNGNEYSGGALLDKRQRPVREYASQMQIEGQVG